MQFKKRCVLITLLIAACITALPLQAQQMKWKKLADNLLRPGNYFTSYEYGAIKSKRNIVLAGMRDLKFSIDSGKTWTEIFPPNLPASVSGIADVDIFDDHTFACISADGYISYTSNRGTTWSQYNVRNGGYALTFDLNTDRIFAIGGNGIIMIIENGSSRLVRNNTISSASDVQVASDGSIHVIGFDTAKRIYLLSSSDKGATWSQSLSTIQQWDCWSFIIDPTDPNIFIVINEDAALQQDGFSDIFLTTNTGNNWKKSFSKPLGAIGTYLSGNATTGCHDYFAGTYPDGILRSTDKGESWISIGGPRTRPDSRTITALDDSLIYVLDFDGSVWVTEPTYFSIAPSDISSAFTDTIGGDAVIHIASHHTGASVDAEFTIHYDTSYLEYHGVVDMNGKDHTISHPDGNSARVALNSGSDSVLFAKFSFYPIDSVCTTVRIDSITPSQTSSQCVQINSSPLSATICSPAGCGRRDIARFMRYGVVPTFSLQPNPTTGEVTLSSSEPFGDAQVEVCNAVGVVERVYNPFTLSFGLQTRTTTLDLSGLPAGMYFVRVHGERAHCVLPVVVGR